ncbi:MAG TPA: DinB family protein [Bryobacteraceae bacterium]
MALDPQEVRRARDYLDKTETGVRDAVLGMSDAQWKFKPAPGRWCAAEIVEHLAIVAAGAEQQLNKMADAPAAPSGRDTKAIDAHILKAVPDRSARLQAPDAILPTGRWTPRESQEELFAHCRHLRSRLESADHLREHVVPNVFLGPLDGYQWILLVAAHNARHTKQILELKSDPNFPAA